MLQPSANISKGGFTFNVWGNYELTDVNDYGPPHGDGKNKFTEIDLTAEYAFSWENFSFPVGIIHYLFPNTSAEATTEIYAGASYDWVVTPSLTVYQDIDEAHGQYVPGQRRLQPGTSGYRQRMLLGARICRPRSATDRLITTASTSAWMRAPSRIGPPP